MVLSKHLLRPILRLYYAPFLLCIIFLVCLWSAYKTTKLKLHSRDSRQRLYSTLMNLVDQITQYDVNMTLLLLDQTLVVSCDQLVDLYSCLKKTKDIELSIDGYFLLGYDDRYRKKVRKNIVQLSEATTIDYGYDFLISGMHGVRIMLTRITQRPNYWIINIPASNGLLQSFALKSPKDRIRVSDKIEILENWPVLTKSLNNGQLIKCKLDLASKLKVDYPNYYVNVQANIGLEAVDHLVYLRDILEEANITMFLFGGTLLGWYRECGIIPYTSDLDVAILSTQHHSQLLNILENNTQFRIWWRLGTFNDSREYVLYFNNLRCDVFVLYQSLDMNSTWVGGLDWPTRTKYRWTYPFLTMDDLCAADLNGHLFNVPCPVEEFLKADYGENWTKPHHSSNYVWYSSGKNVHEVGKWNESEWPAAFKKYSY